MPGLSQPATLPGRGLPCHMPAQALDYNPHHGGGEVGRLLDKELEARGAIVTTRVRHGRYLAFLNQVHHVAGVALAEDSLSGAIGCRLVPTLEQARRRSDLFTGAPR